MTYDWRPNGDLQVIDQLPAIVDYPQRRAELVQQVVIQHFNRRNSSIGRGRRAPASPFLQRNFVQVFLPHGFAALGIAVPKGLR